MLISIVIPCYYSEKTIGAVVDLIAQEFEQHPGYSWECILANDGSKDGNFDEIHRLANR